MARLLDASDPLAVAEAAATLARGGMVVFPTETVYGLGADAFQERAVAGVFQVKRRPSFDPLIVHIAHRGDLDRLAAEVDGRARMLADRFWPGPLTLILPKQASVPDIVTAGLPTVAVRIPDHPAALALIRAAGSPVAAPSANPFGYVSPTTAAHVVEQLGERVGIILDGGPCRIGLESTVLSLVHTPPQVLRPGGVPLHELQTALGSPVAIAAGSGGRPQAPGQLPRHYATRTPLHLHLEPGIPIDVRHGDRVGLLAFRTPSDPTPFAAVEVLAPDGNLRTAASRLFASLRRLDALGLDRLVAESCPEEGLGLAIMDRLRRCAGGVAPAERHRTRIGSDSPQTP